MDLLRLAQADSLTNTANTARVINAVHEDRHWTPCSLSMEYKMRVSNMHSTVHVLIVSQVF